MDYAERNRILLDLNVTNHNDTYPLLSAIENDNTEIVKLLMDYAKRYNIKLEIKAKNKFYDYPLLLAIEKNNTKIVKLLFSYAQENGIPLEIEDGYFYKSDKHIESFKYPLLCAIEQNNTQVTRLLINYARKHSILLEMNKIYFNTISVEKVKYPLLCAAQHNNSDIVKLLTDYAYDNNILLELNEKYEIIISELNKKFINDIPVKKEYTPLLYAIENDNIDIVKLLIEYAKNMNTTLKIKIDYIKYVETSEISETLEICWSEKLNYPCCKSSYIYSTDNDGDWGYKDHHWFKI
ncbi:ankyrin [Anaeromyces robustus]|uniref:Ankyrin n=1 Tax=Anaeromyces robustus TaxID=1754192 RepID=A0A1Y1X591_9FUNG|nr:ankyrin [Anaeromyces robustus]|eukprot:ORX80484.1 ankyrin [Anaeromyces robustus]